MVLKILQISGLSDLLLATWLAVWHSGNTLSPSAKLCYARPSVTVLGQVNQHPARST